MYMSKPVGKIIQPRRSMLDSYEKLLRIRILIPSSAGLEQKGSSESSESSHRYIRVKKLEGWGKNSGGIHNFAK